MRTLIMSLLISVAFGPGEQYRPVSTAIRAQAQPASVELTPLADGRPVRLPALEFALRIEPVCSGEAEARSVSISVADTQLRFAASDIAGQVALETVLTLPPEQAGPVRIDDFCRETEDDDTQSLLLKDVFTARLSLRCGPDDEPTMVYATLPLDVALTCNREDAAEPTPD